MVGTCRRAGTQEQILRPTWMDPWQATAGEWKHCPLL